MKETKSRIIFRQKNLKGHINVEKSIHIFHCILWKDRLHRKQQRKIKTIENSWFAKFDLKEDQCFF